MKRTMLVGLVGFVLTSSGQAHHSFLAEFDPAKPMHIGPGPFRVES